MHDPTSSALRNDEARATGPVAMDSGIYSADHFLGTNTPSDVSTVPSPSLAGKSLAIDASESQLPLSQLAASNANNSYAVIAHVPLAAVDARSKALLSYEDEENADDDDDDEEEEEEEEEDMWRPKGPGTGPRAGINKPPVQPPPPPPPKGTNSNQGNTNGSGSKK